MKNLTIVFLMISSLLLGHISANAVTTSTKKDRTKTKMVSSTEQVGQIMDLIGTPSLDIRNESKLVVHYSINEHNLIEVNDVETESKALKNYVMRNMNGKRIKGNDIEVKDLSLNIVFKSEKNEIYTIY